MTPEVRAVVTSSNIKNVVAATKSPFSKSAVLFNALHVIDENGQSEGGISQNNAAPFSLRRQKVMIREINDKTMEVHESQTAQMKLRQVIWAVCKAAGQS